MSTRPSFDRRIAAGVALGALLGAALLGRDAMPWALTIAGVAVLWMLWRIWDSRRRGRRLVEGLRARWLELPGAREGEAGRVHVHDGMQPLTVRPSHRKGALRVAVATPIGESPVAFRIWPRDTAPPSLDPDGAPVGGPPVERAPRIEARLDGRLRVESSDEPRVDAILDPEVTAALLVVSREAAGSFEGLGYDGQRLTVHLRGPIAADSERAARLARALWEPFMP
ncbi:MAG: hypothetical protein ACQEXJ_20005 [Myxococcota bacterium]